MGAGRDDRLFPAVQSLLSQAGLAASDLGGVVCGEGPGSFTSLRIAGALAKGLAHGAGIPLFAVPSLLLAAANLPDDATDGGYVVHADALRGERYVLPVLRREGGRVDMAGPVARVAAEVLASSTEPAWRIAVLHSTEALPSAFQATPSLRGLARADGFWASTPVDLGAWEPSYGRLAEAQVKWEATHGTALPSPLPIQLPTPVPVTGTASGAT